MGIILVAIITPASVQDRDGAVPVLQEAHREYPTLERLWVDGAYHGRVIDQLRESTKLAIEVVKRSDDVRGFVVLPKRWVVERSFGWAGRFRRLARDYEQLAETLAGLHFVAFAILMLQRFVALTVQSA